MEDNWESFKDDPWDGISINSYPTGRRLYLNDERYWISRNSLNQLVFYIQDVCPTFVPVAKNISSVDLSVEQYSDGEQRLVCTFLESLDIDNQKFGLAVKSITVESEEFQGVELFLKVQEELQDWASFLKNNNKKLTRSELIGFWGELYVISHEIMQDHDPKDAIRYWAGPKGKKDITLSSIAIEVKTTISSSSKEIKISSLDQLDSTTEKLYLMHLFINTADKENGISLDRLYELIRSSVQHDFAVLALFIRKAGSLFEKAGSRQKEEPFVCSEINMYEVREGFPRLLRTNVPMGVMEAKYSLSIASVQAFCVTKNIRDIIKNG
jgi:hypothetical protein